MSSENAGAPDDLACGRSGRLIWGVPWAMIAAGAIWTSVLYWLWIPAFLVAGVACIYNARRCGRTHCYLTGPLYLLAAGYVALAAADVVPLPVVWFLVIVVAVSLAMQAVETRIGRYRGRTRIPSLSKGRR